MKILGVDCLNHDAAVTLIEDDKILFAAHAERYSRVKNDSYLNDSIIEEALSFGMPDRVAFFEKPWLKKTRQLYAKQFSEAFSIKNIPSVYLKRWFDNIRIDYVEHHLSHAAAGYYTSPYDEALVIVIDAIGEWDVVSIWLGSGDNLRKVYSIKYPHSLGLFYSAMTKRVGLKPQEDEYILMGMSAWGKPKHSKEMEDFFFNFENQPLEMRYNLHKGVGDYEKLWGKFDIAASAQLITEKIIERIFLKAKSLYPNIKNVVYSGGVALNCVANSLVVAKLYDNVWIMPSPGDSGSSLGAAAAVYEKHLCWDTPFLGTNISGGYPTESLLKRLLKGDIVGVANGRAEFGPRALGNRSLLADPRGKDIKDKMNVIKRRQKFRPFAPAILEEEAHNFFEMPLKKTPYMQFIAKCKYPDIYPAICHVDNTSRVQTVSKKDNLGFYNLLKRFHQETGCPMLVNTSLNIKGQPIVNTKQDAMAFSSHYNVEVL